MKLTSLFLITILLTLFSAQNLFADSKNIKSEKDKTIMVVDKSDKKITNQSGSRVFQDPDTGKFITPEEAKKKGIFDIRDSIRIGPPEFVEDEILEERLPNGGFKLKLPSTFNHTMKATINDSSKIKTTCNHK